jgi:tetratricopeptide (TPR) repeat protein
MTDLQLETLEARGLIRVATLQPELEYLFRHALLQDTAYGSLLKQERKALHQVVGAALEDLYPERVGELAAVLAMHFEQSGDTEKALTYLISAAEFAVARNALTEGYDLYTRAYGLLPPATDDDDDPLRRRRVGIQLGRARAGFTFMSEEDALAIVEPVIPDTERLGDLRLEADARITAAMLRQFRRETPESSPELRRELERVSEIAAELDDPIIAALPESIIGLVRVFTGEIRSGVEMLERAAPQLALKRDFVGSSFALVALAFGYARLGEFDKATAAADRAWELAEHGDVIARLDAMIGRATVYSIRGDLDTAIPIVTQCTNDAEATGAVACVVASNFTLGDAFMRQGKFEDAQRVFERGGEVADAIRERSFRPSITAYLHANAASMGVFGPSGASFDEALAQTRMGGDRWSEANVVWKRADVSAKRIAIGMPQSDDERETMLGDFEAASREFERMGARPFHARVLRDWGDALRSLGRGDEGNQRLREGLALFDELGITREAEEVRAKLTA